jgi:hypothetical protein
VPETSVYKDGDPMLGEGEVGPSGEAGMAAPAAYVCAPQEACKRYLCLLVAASFDEGHCAATLGAGQIVSHLEEVEPARRPQEGVSRLC